MDQDWDLRVAAFDYLNRHIDASGVVRLDDLVRGFEFRGERIPLINTRRGIWRPRQLGDGPALSVTTAPQRVGRQRPYDDEIASDGWFTYKYEKNNPDTWTNRAVRRAMEMERPLIYFYGDAPGTYYPIYPVYVMEDDPRRLTFRLAPDAMAALALGTRADPAEVAARRAYTTQEVKRRLHQGRFRFLVLHAYRSRCSVCRLRHDVLLDAAHILPDREERGRPEVPNGLALCKIHHAAFDADILGVTPKCIIQIRHDILAEHDGPMLQHGIKEMDGMSLSVPRDPLLKPNPEYLAERYDRFRAA